MTPPYPLVVNLALKFPIFLWLLALLCQKALVSLLSSYNLLHHVVGKKELTLALAFQNFLTINFDSYVFEKFGNPSVFDNKTLFKFDPAAYNDLIFTHKQVRILVKDKVKDLRRVCTRIHFFRNFVIKFGIFETHLKVKEISGLKKSCKYFVIFS